jgi:Autographiviridae RNA polymerase
MNYDKNDERITAELLNLQKERESASLAAGRDQFLRAIEEAARGGAFARTQVGRDILREWLEPLEQAIREWQRSAGKPHTGPKRLGEDVTKEWIGRVGPKAVAFVALTTVIDSLRVQQDYRQVCLSVSTTLQLELRSQRLKEQAPTLFKHADSNPQRERESAFLWAFQHIDTADLDITQEQKVQMGGALVELLRASTHIVETYHVGAKHPKYRKGRPYWPKVLKLRATPKIEKWLNERIACLAVHQTQAQPMLVPPLPWAPGQRGGYRFALRGWYPLVRRGLETKETKEWDVQLEKVEHVEGRPSIQILPMEQVYTALSALQDTSWCINRPVYDLVREIRKRGGDTAGIPKTTPYTLPTGTRRMKKDVQSVRDKNDSRKALTNQIERVLNAAESVLDLTIWFPYNLDWRGRIYPIPDSLHPQGSDLAKALLVFGQGKPIDDTGERWLANHGANRLGKTPDGTKVSGMTFDERVEWVRANTDLLVRVADDPFADLWWADARKVDDPLQFYAFCVEWRNLTLAKQRGVEFVSSLPCSMDGSCNGLQHFSAMFRDEKGGAEVNLVPLERPQDMYQRVADKVLEKLEAQRLTNPLAANVLDTKLVTRKVVKRPTMSFFYSATRLAPQLWDELEQERQDWPDIKAQLGGPKQAFDGCRLVEGLIIEAIGEIAGKAAEAMEWLQKCARAIVKAGRSPEWRLPTGFAVRQVYPKTRTSKVKTVFAGKWKYVSLDTATDERDVDQHERGIAPNVIHSLDAAALVFTLNWAAAGSDVRQRFGVVSFAAAHDCYVTVAADCALVDQGAHQAFTDLYTSHNMREALYAQFKAQLNGTEADGEALEPPSTGTLDPNAWLASDNLFS